MKDTCRYLPVIRHKLLKWTCNSAEPWVGDSVPRGAWGGLGLCLNSRWEMQGANLFSSAGLNVGQVKALQSNGERERCEGLLKHLANIKVLRHQNVNSASFLLVNWRQCFPSPNSWSNQNISKVSHSFCTQPRLHRSPIRVGSRQNSWSGSLPG